MSWFRRLALGVALALFWLALSGHLGTLLLTLGAVSVLLTLLLAQRLLAGRQPLGLLRVARLPGYCLWLAWEACQSNLYVAGLLLRPRLRVSPCVLRLGHGRRTDLVRALYANSITITPGTLTLRMHESSLEVHALTARTAAALRTGTMERRLGVLESAGEDDGRSGGARA